MPEVTLNPRNQCTLDDATGGADLPSVVPNARSSNEVPMAPLAPACLADEPGSGGTTSECTHELVRQFAGSDGPAAPAPVTPKRSCVAEAVSVGSNCGKVAYEVARRREYNPMDVASCAAAVVSFGLCEFGGD
jgi:hypothetical protein